MAWKTFRKIFHAMEKIQKSFPYCGKSFEKFSMVWKTAGK
jgi:hypothetical protein